MSIETQNNIRNGGELVRVELKKGLMAGENPYRLLAKAVRGIAQMTGDKLFFDDFIANMKTIYGNVMGDIQVKQADREATKKWIERLKKALETETDDDARQRIRHAIRLQEVKLKERG